MYKINESLSLNKEEKSSRLIIISKDRIQSAKNKVNFITLKEGDLKYTVQLKNDYLNKNGINNAVQTLASVLRVISILVIFALFGIVKRDQLMGSILSVPNSLYT